MSTLQEHRRAKIKALQQIIKQAQTEIAAVIDASAKSHIAANYPYVSAIHVQFDDRYDGAPSARSTRITLIDGSSYDVSSGYIEPGYAGAVRALGHVPELGMLSDVEEIMLEGIDARWAAHKTCLVELEVTRAPGKLA